MKTPLEITLAVAEIDGFLDADNRDEVQVMSNFLGISRIHGSSMELIKFCPLVCPKECFTLIVKYRINIVFNDDNSHSAYYSKTKCITHRSLKHAVCLAIIEKHPELLI